MSPHPRSPDTVGVIFPTGMLGGGFPRELLGAGISLGASAIAVDAGSTDSGPYYLGSGTAKTTAAAVEGDLRILLTEARAAGIPVLVGSCGTSGTDSGVDEVTDMVERIAKEETLSFRLARIYSEQSPDDIADALAGGHIRPLPPSGQVDEATIRSCTHIVGLMGHEPMMAALHAGADVILAGRATDTAMVAAIGLAAGMPTGPTWHAAKTVECGGMCTTNPRAAGTSSPVLAVIDLQGFEVIPLHPDAACTPRTVAAHMLYENADPFFLREPTGTLDTTQASYRARTDRIVRVEGSRFEPAPTTIKLEGARLAGYETISITGMRDPIALAHVDMWLTDLTEFIDSRVNSLLELDPGSYALDARAYGHNAVLGRIEGPITEPPPEVGVVLKVRAEDQATATAIAKIANPALLHMPTPGMVELPSFAFATSPAEIERGASYEFTLNHAIEVSDGHDLFRPVISEVRN